MQASLMLQILMDGPYQDNYIIIPDSSGIFVVDAFEPLFIDTGGAVYLAEDLITSVGQLVAGSIGRGFGEHFAAGIVPCTVSALLPAVPFARPKSRDVSEDIILHGYKAVNMLLVRHVCQSATSPQMLAASPASCLFAILEMVLVLMTVPRSRHFAQKS